MKKWNKVLALILALAVAVSNLPPVLVSAATRAGAGRQTRSTDTDTGMRLRQTDFDSKTGILTMSLEVKTSEVGKVGKNEYDFDTYEGRFPKELYFAFLVDPQSVEPITAAGEPINVGSGKIGFVGMDQANMTTGSELSDFLSPSIGAGEQVAKGFNTSMGTVTADGKSPFAEDYSGYFTALDRSDNTKNGSDYLGCYLHLKWSQNWNTFEEVLDDEGNSTGYVKAIDLYFQCYSGDYDSEGNRKKANSEYALFCNSICLPGGVLTAESSAASEPSQEDVNELLNRFVVYNSSYTKNDTSKQKYLAVGAAGFMDAARTYQGLATETKAYYAYDKAQTREWLNTAESDKTAYENATQMNIDPTIKYENQDKKYTIIGFEASITNTYCNEEEYDGSSDFYNPKDQNKMPQYSVPYQKEMDGLIAAEDENDIWQPKANYFDDNDVHYVALKYNLTTKVSNSSLTKPELEADAENRLNEDFLENIEWGFALKESDEGELVSLDSFAENDKLSDTHPTTGEQTPAAEVVTLYSDPSYPHTYTVREMYIVDTNSNYYGCKVQTVQETTEGLDADNKVHVTPVGVMFDFSEKTMVSYNTLKAATSGTEEYERSEAKESYAPQLRIDARAGDDESYLWLNKVGTGVGARKGRVYLTTTYHEPNDGDYTSVGEVAVQLHRDDALTPSYTTVEMDESYLDTTEGAAENAYAIKLETVNGLLNGNELNENGKRGLKIDAKLFDQYGASAVNSDGEVITPSIAISGANSNNVALKEDEVAFAASYDSTENVYYLIYKQTKEKTYDGNDVIEGTYKIQAVYGTLDESSCATLTLSVTKDANKFSYLDTGVTLTSQTSLANPGRYLYRKESGVYQGNPIQNVYLSVPAKTIDSNGTVTTHKIKVSIDPVELANQWRDGNSETQIGGSAYDVMSGLRDADGTFQKALLRANFNFEYTCEDKNGKQPNMTGVTINAQTLSDWSFIYDSTTANGTKKGTQSNGSDEVVSDPLYLTIKATRKNGAPDEVQTNRYCIYFVRDNSTLSTIKGSYNGSEPGRDVNVKMEVPESGTTSTATVEFAPYDQYDDMMDWSTVQTSSGMNWQMCVNTDTIKDGSGKKLTELPTGITVSTTGTITLNEHATACSFEVYASYGGMNSSDATGNNGLSQKITVTISKAASVPAKIRSINPELIRIQVPSKGSAANTNGPKIVVLDQYGDVMNANDYKAEWSFVAPDAATTKTPASDPLVSLDKRTGQITVSACAQAWDNVAMKVILRDRNDNWMKDITTNNVYYDLKIVRNNPPAVTTLNITSESVAYPVAEADDRTAALAMTAETEYGTDPGDVTAVWVLNEVTYKNGTTVKRSDNDITLSSEEYSDKNGTVSLNRETGIVTFGNAVTDFNLAPVSIQVACSIGTSASETKTINVTYGSQAITSITRQPTEIKFLAGMSDEIQIPTTVDESDYERELKAQVHDQFGFVMKAEDGDNVACTWKLAEQKPGVSLSGNTLKIAKGQATAGTVTVNVSYTANNVTATNVLEIGMYKTRSEPTTMVPLSVGETEITNNAVTLAMPTFTGPRAEDAVAASYTLKARVLDGYQVHLTSRTIKWKVVTDQYKIATITGNNKLTLKNTDAWVNVGSPDNVEIELEAYDSAVSSVTQTVTITLKKEAIYAAYAQPKLETVTDKNSVSWPKYSQRTGYTDCLQIPSISDYTANGNQPYKAYFTSTVYSQYRTEISDTTAWPVTYDICHPNTESNSITGLTIEQDGLNGAVLKIGTNVDITLSNIWIVAKPTNDKATLVNSVNNCNVKFDAGISYSAGLALGSDYYAQDEAEQDKNVPTWEPGPDKNIPTTEETYVRYELNAFVHDQRGANYSTVGGGTAYPVWQLGENAPEGVTFTNPTNDSTYGNNFDGDGNVKGETVYLWVSSRAIANGATTLDVPVKVWANGKADGGEAFVKEITLTLTRGNPTATHLYFNNAKNTDTDGAGLGESIARPTAGESAKVVDISGIVYDAYGIPYSGAEMNITVMGANLPSDVEVVDVTGTAAKAADKDATEAPLPLLSQKIMRGETLLAELVMGANGKATLSVYGTCDLANIELELECEGISGSKILRLPITQQTRTAKTITLSQLDDEEDEPEAIEDNKAEVIIEKNAEGYQLVRFFAEMIDQYSESYTDTAGTFKFKWSVLTEGDIGGTWMDYKETDGDGNEPETAKRFLQYDSTNGALSLMINPDNYKNKLSLKVKCELVQKSNNMSVTSDEFELTLRRRSSNSNSSAFGAYTVTYLAGDHGTITSIITSELVLEGTSPKLIPTVAAEKGYALRGWMSGGELIPDPGTMKIYNDVTLVAQYIVLDDYKFVSGYSDGTVRTEQNVTRGEFIRMLVGAATSYKPGPNNQYANVFSDVEEDAYYRDYAAYAYFYGIVSGYEDGTFRPDDPITRAEAASMIAKAKGITPNAGEKIFKDLNPDAWYTGYAEALGREGILSGYEDGTFRPENNLTRAEAITMLVRISDGAPSEREADNLRKTADTPFKDVDRKHWAFPYVVRAAGVA